MTRLETKSFFLGHLLPLAISPEDKIVRSLFVGVNLPHHAFYEEPEVRQMGVKHFEAAAQELGYFPSRQGGFGDDIPRDAGLDWVRMDIHQSVNPLMLKTFCRCAGVIIRATLQVSSLRSTMRFGVEYSHSYSPMTTLSVQSQLDGLLTAYCTCYPSLMLLVSRSTLKFWAGGRSATQVHSGKHGSRMYGRLCWNGFPRGRSPPHLDRGTGGIPVGLVHIRSSMLL